MNKNEFKNLVVEIAKEACVLKDKHTGEKLATINYACVFAQSDDEFSALAETTKQLGNVIKETATGPIFRIRPLCTVSGKLNLLKIRRPDTTRPERGDADFTVGNYLDFKKKYARKIFFKLLKYDNFEMIELKDPEFNVRAYFSDPTLDEQLKIK